MLSPGSRLATYEVRKRLAVGGMGEVYLCRHRLLDRDDAVKVLRPHLVADQAFRRRFLREALSAARLRHPHIVTVYTADEVDNQLYLAMEYIPGADLAAILDHEQVLEPRRAVRLLDQVADALDAAHRLQMTHRDVKPSNVLVERPGSPDLQPGGPHGGPEHAYLVDFGLSKSAQQMDQDITMTGQVLGTVAYIAPEQLQGATTDGRTDQYSLGCMTFEILTGQLPFARDNQVATITAHLTTPPPLLTTLQPDLPTAVDRVVARAMAKSPEERFATCKEFVDALRSAVETGETTVVQKPPPRLDRRTPSGAEARQEQAWANPANQGAAVVADSLGDQAPLRIAARRPVDRTPPPPPSGPVGAVEPPPVVTPSAEPEAPAVPGDPAAPPGFTLPDDTPFGLPPLHDLPPDRSAGNPYTRPGAPPSGIVGRTPAPSSGVPLSGPAPTSGGGYRSYPAGAPLPSGPTPAGRTLDSRLYLAVVGGPDAGRLVPLPDGERKVPIGRVTLGFTVSGWTVQVAGETDSQVNGEPLHGVRQLTPGDLLTAGTALMEVRSARHLARLAPNSPPPDPVTLDRVARDRLAGAVRGPQHPQALVTRIGWLARRPPVPIAVPVGNAGGIAIRGPLPAAVPLARWLITQAAVLHDARDLSIAVAAGVTDDERWAWVQSLPHARPATPPLAGPHVAPTRDAALDLTSRLRQLVEVRRAAAADPRARQLLSLPRVLAVLDDRLGGPDAEFVTAVGGNLGVHVVRLLPPEARPPASCRLCIDLDPSGQTLTVWVAGRNGAQKGVPDGVSAQYAHEVAELLAEG
ncbi:protein kinase domain-containing protein [Cryptosporangium arvum]|uniref:non-specific serine/threonine protein kinase n=1 Tax=Cryptosporangium arvum DSM 44712 TaxID=927661 RepID=A0A011AD20_9ACTN|nr:protein kinase [Cryptosporangium arvum]EXG79951.1 serine/threonine protein kinase [Cryptosporangium arvum DSM 44712]